MAYSKINWEAGELKKDGYVIVDGEQYQTVQPEYTGNTPINPDNLNHMDDGIELANRKDIITVVRTADFIINQSDAYVDIPFDSSESIGTGLTLNNGGVLVDSSISKVKISCKVCFPYDKMTAGQKNLVIKKNGVIVDRTWQYLEATRNSNMLMPTRIISVTKGDVLTVGYYGKQNDKITGGAIFTDFTVEAVEYQQQE